LFSDVEMKRLKYIRDFNKEFLQVRELGRGSFGKCIQVMNLSSGIVCATKVISKSLMNKSDRSA